LVLAIAILSVSAMAQQAMVGEGGTDILGDGIFETDDGAFQFPILADTNFDSVQVGDDKATSFGMGNGFPFGFRNGPANAENNLEIKKNQDSGICAPCVGEDEYGEYCMNSCLNLNIEQIKVGNREALAFGFASAVNNVKIVTNQADSEASLE
jgi:hypothetical protein